MLPVVPKRAWSLSRISLLRAKIADSAKVLEIGPLFRPIAPRDKGFNAFSLDVCDDAELKKIYAHTGNADKIGPVDFIQNKGGLAASIPEEHHGTFDVIIASHVLEHVPNPIAFIQDCGTLLKPGGHLSLALPDMRYCFDSLRQKSASGEWIEAFQQSRVDHSWRSVFESSVYSAARNGRIAWPLRRPFPSFTFLGKALEAGYHDASSPKDCHAWVFTPASFALITQECYTLGLIPLSTASVTKTRMGEFFAHLQLSRGEAIDHHGRMRLLRLSHKER